MSDIFSGKFGGAIPIPFTLTNATTQMTNEDFKKSGGALTYEVMPGGGNIVAVSANCAAVTAGTITLGVHVASTELADTGTPAPVLSSTADTNGTYATVRPGAVSFDAGDTLGLSATTTTTLDPTNTLDVDATLWVVLDQS